MKLYSQNVVAVLVMMLNVLAYADDLVLLAPSWRAMQDLLHLLSKLSISIDMTCSTKKTVCMVFQPKQHSKTVAKSFPPLRLGDECLQCVSSFKYLRYVILNNLTDDSDIQREICNMFVRTNKLVLSFTYTVYLSVDISLVCMFIGHVARLK